MIQNSKLPPKARLARLAGARAKRAKGGKIQNSRKGFTLIELIVSMAIIGILAATAVVNFANNADRDVRQEKERLISFLREVQNKALTGDREGITLTSGAKLCSFGIQITSPSSFKMFFVESADLNTNCDYFFSTNSDLDSITTKEPSPTSTFTLKNGVEISSSSSFATGDRIYFLLPNGQIYSKKNRPINININKGLATPIPVTIEQSGRIY